MTTTTYEDFQTVLTADGRSPDIPESADVYGWLIGSWDLDIYHYAAVDVKRLNYKGEVHFEWILEGRAIQDVWITPRKSERVPQLGKANNMYGTTLRVWDAFIQAWRITWVNPVTGHREEQIGRWSGPDIVQLGMRFNGTPTRWRYTGITADSFHWLGEALEIDGKTWKLEGEFQATRRKSCNL